MNNKYRRTSLIAACAMFATSVAASDLPSEKDTFKKWGEADGWTLYVNETRNDCVAERVEADGDVLSLGVTKDGNFGYIGVFTQADLGLKSGKDRIRVSINDKPYEGPTQRVTRLADGYEGGYLLANNPVFIDDVMRQYEMVVSPGDENSFTLSLDGTYRAIEAARKCVAELN